MDETTEKDREHWKLENNQDAKHKINYITFKIWKELEIWNNEIV